MTPLRIWFDVSYTRTQTTYTGITRTVRRLFAQIREQHPACQAVAFAADGFRSVDFSVDLQTDKMSTSDSGRHRLFGMMTGRVARSVVGYGLRILPWRMLRPLWVRMATHIFHRLSADGQPVWMRPGDLLIVADAAYNYPVWLSVRRARAQGAKVVLLVHDLIPIRYPQYCFALVPRVFETFLREMASSCDAILCNSDATKRDLCAWADEEGLALPPVGYVHLGCDAVAPQTDNQIRAIIRNFVNVDTPCFVAIGAFEPRKNYAQVVAAFERLWREGSQARLLIAGRQTTECAEFIGRLRDHPQQGKLLLTVHDANDDELNEIYAHCRALIFASLAEGFGLPLAEARSRGCRVLASRIPAFVELADDGVWFFDPADNDAMVNAISSLCGPSQPPVAPGRVRSWSDCARDFLAIQDKIMTST